MHAADCQVYEVVKRIFEQRWRRADARGGGVVTHKSVVVRSWRALV